MGVHTGEYDGTTCDAWVVLVVDTSGWAKFPGGSARGSRYTVIDKATTFYGAQERCQQLGGYVVHINSLREQLFIEDFLTQLLDRRRQQQDGTRPQSPLVSLQRSRLRRSLLELSALAHSATPAPSALSVRAILSRNSSYSSGMLLC